MGQVQHINKSFIFYGSNLAEHIVDKGLSWKGSDLYDIKTIDELDVQERLEGVFAQLMQVESPKSSIRHYYRICLQDDTIIDFLGANRDIDTLTFMIYILTHELLHMHRFSTGQADFNHVNENEEVFVDSLTRLLMAKHPISGMQNVLKLLDKMVPPQLYSFTTIVEQEGSFNAYL